MVNFSSLSRVRCAISDFKIDNYPDNQFNITLLCMSQPFE